MKRVFAGSLLVAAVGFMGCGEAPLGVENAAVDDVAAPLFSHNSLHGTACDLPGTVGGGTLGNSPGLVGPPSSLGWDVGGGQCNGSFTMTTDAGFPGGTIELGLRAEERRVGQVARSAPNDYAVSTGADLDAPPALNRAWWNFQGSIAYNGNINDLDALTLTIITKAGPNLPSLPFFDMLAARPGIDDRNNQPNPTAGFGDLYQFSQNPEFGWFAPTSDTDGNPSAFDYDAEGAWLFTLLAIEDGETASVTACIHTPAEADQCVGARARKADVQSALEALLPTGDKKTDKRIEKAIKELTQSLNDDYWVDELHLTKKGKKVFSDQRKAAHELEKVVKDGGAFAGDAQAAIDELVKADAELAEVAIAEAIAGGGDAKEIEKAQKEVAKALDELAEGDFDKAIEKYGKAWYHAMKALKKVL